MDNTTDSKILKSLATLREVMAASVQCDVRGNVTGRFRGQDAIRASERARTKNEFIRRLDEIIERAGAEDGIYD